MISRQLAILDSTNSLKLLVVDSTKPQKPEFSAFKRTDVWNVAWSSDNQDMFITMEKTKMNIFKNLEPEVFNRKKTEINLNLLVTYCGLIRRLKTPYSCTAYVFAFSDLQVKLVSLDEIMKRPEHPELDDLIEFDTKVLTDAKELLNESDLSKATQFIESNPHQKLW